MRRRSSARAFLLSPDREDWEAGESRQMTLGVPDGTPAEALRRAFRSRQLLELTLQELVEEGEDAVGWEIQNALVSGFPAVPARKNGAILAADFNNKERSRRTF